MSQPIVFPFSGHLKVIKATYVWTHRRGHRTAAAAASANAAASMRRGLPLGGEKCRAMEKNIFYYFQILSLFPRVVWHANTTTPNIKSKNKMPALTNTVSNKGLKK